MRMKLKKLVLHDVRSFRGHREISFVDPATGAPRDRLVLVGSNGTGKTTAFDVVDALLQYLLHPGDPPQLLRQIEGLAALTVEFSLDEVSEMSTSLPLGAPGTRELTIAYGFKDVAPESPEKEWPEHAFFLGHRGTPGKPRERASRLARDVRGAVLQMREERRHLEGGLIYFPHDRLMRPPSGRGGIEPPPREPRWIYRYSGSDQWTGSLEQAWVWQNYLDLEAQARGEQTEYLTSAIALLALVLGSDRQVTVREGRVLVTTRWVDDTGEHRSVHLEALPSGERQCVILLGELARRRRRGGVLFIDEPEISLHPTLQRRLMSQLRAVARELDLQLVVATHSLEIIRSVPGSDVFSLDADAHLFDEEAGLEAE